MKPVTLFKLIVHFFLIRPDVVNLHFPDQQLFECYLLKFMFRFKLIISLHGNEVERMGILKKNTLRYYFYEKLFKSAVLITGCSKYLLDEFQKIFPQIESRKHFAIHNGVGELYLNQNVTENKINHIFSAARFVPKKGFELLLEATQKFTGNQLLIAGGDENDFLTLGLKKREGLILLGPLSQDELAKYLAEAELTVIPSKKEPFGIIVAEAICCGSPVVATNVGGIPEVIASATEKLNPTEKEIFNQWVKLVEPNVESIRNGIDSLLNNNGSIEDYINLVPKFRNNFFWSIRLNKFHTILTKL
jgi:glycosyltransferase involved in cell wall biosynthesis